MRDPFLVPFSIASGQSLSSAVSVAGMEVVGIVMPAGWDAAGLTFQSVDDPELAAGTYQNVYDTGGTELSFTVAAARRVNVNPLTFGSHALVKVRSGTSGVAVNQTAARTGYLVCRPRQR